MFVSTNFLSINYGVDDAIAKFFVDREPPVNNLYWKDKLLYLRPEAGWLFIPLIADLLYKAGVSKEQVTSKEFVGLLENIGHLSAKHELKILSDDELLNNLVLLTQNNHQNASYYNNLLSFMAGKTDNLFTNLATPFKALHRGDAFLFALCALNFPDDLQTTLVKYWFALISTLLLLDDAQDIESDRHSNDENAFIESGLTPEGLEKIKALAAKNLRFISAINRSMAATLDKKLISISSTQSIQQLLNK